jgi:hypothetical protein
LIVGLGAVLAWRIVVEAIEPHYLLRLQRREPHVEVALPSGSVLRLYGDTRPHVGKIASLQKGLVWIHEGRVLVEEGYGFGCPIVLSAGRAYVSKEAQVEIVQQDGFTRLIKRFAMDTVDTPIQPLRRKYRSVPSLGSVTFTYDVYADGTIDIAVDLTELQGGWEQVYLMNEQGARHFTRYYDVQGRDLKADEIGIWEASNAFIERGCFEHAQRDLTFCVEPTSPAVVYYGRERYNQYNWRGIFYLSWSGIDIELPPPRDVYHYRVTLEDR